ncbi:MAG: hypothetical protein A4E36_00186 [Methanoregulaceae archaeon PtaB.Bin009]|jgi:hypothetical protein|nr:MAG: hypothetical protein A4E36_00186 [Methanoregulaceae archaeon PtaB.Bin009]
MKENMKKSLNDRGVSETVGYIILFGIMTTGIALVTLYGYPLLLEEQANANIRNMERNMLVLQNDVKSLSFKNVPYRETALQISGGVLKVEKSTPTDNKYFKVIKVSANQELIPDPPFLNNEFHPGQLLFTSDKGDILIGLQNGAVVKREQGGSTMLSEPRWFLDTSGTERTLVLLFTQFDADAEYAKSGIGIIQMSLEDPTEISYHFTPSPENIRVEYRDTLSDYFSAWRNYFNTFNPSASPPLSVTVLNVDNLIMKFYKIKIIGI